MLDALAAAVVVLTIAAFIWFMDAIGKNRSHLIDVWPADEDDLAAQATVPEFAAARNAPDYSGRCRCAACRKRPNEPCSDYDGA